MVRVALPLHTILNTLEEDIEEFDDVQGKRHQRHDQHEDDEDGFLGGTREKAVHLMWAGISFASVNGAQAESVDVPLDQQEGHLEDGLEEDADDVGSQQAPSHFHLAVLFDTVLELLYFDLLQVHVHIHTVSLGNFQFLLPLVQFLFLPHHVEHMCQVQERGDRHEDDLQDPETHVRDREGLVIADVLTTRLLGVAAKGRLLITPGGLNCCPQQQDSENEKD